MTLQGDGFATEQGIVPDYWEFNTDNLSGPPGTSVTSPLGT